MRLKLMSDFLSINRQLLQFVILLDDLPHRARLDDHAILLPVIAPCATIANLMALQVSVRLCLLLVEHLVDDMSLGGPRGNPVVIEL